MNFLAKCIPVPHDSSPPAPVGPVPPAGVDAHDLVDGIVRAVQHGDVAHALAPLQRVHGRVKLLVGRRRRRHAGRAAAVDVLLQLLESRLAPLERVSLLVERPRTAAHFGAAADGDHAARRVGGLVAAAAADDGGRRLPVPVRRAVPQILVRRLLLQPLFAGHGAIQVGRCRRRDRHAGPVMQLLLMICVFDVEMRGWLRVFVDVDVMLSCQGTRSPRWA